MHNTPLSGISADRLNALLDDAFGTDRHMRTAYLLRKGMAAIDHLSFGILDDDALLASIQCWPVRIGMADLVLVGPVAVASHRQNEGLGKRLMQLMLNAATAHDAPMVVIRNIMAVLVLKPRAHLVGPYPALGNHGVCFCAMSKWLHCQHMVCLAQLTRL